MYSRRVVREGWIRGALLACALLSVTTTVGIVVVLATESAKFFQAVSPFEFLFGTTWSPLIEPRHFGVLPLLAGTLMVAAGALLIAVPVGLGTAVYLSEYAPRWLRGVVKPVLEMLAGIPTVVYGFFALTFITPHVLQPLIPGAEAYNAASAAIVVGVMVIPTISALCDDAFRAVPQTLREAAFALSATRLEVSTHVVMPAAASGIASAVLLAFARAIGETMAVSLAAGLTPRLTFNPFEGIQTMTSYLVQVSLGDTPAGTLEYQTLFAVGITLFVITSAVNIAAHRLFGRFREVYV